MEKISSKSSIRRTTSRIRAQYRHSPEKDNLAFKQMTIVFLQAEIKFTSVF